MKVQFFGDSYDIVKKSLIEWLSEFGSWSAHPMFTEVVAPDKAASFSRFLGIPLISTEPLTPATDRAKYFLTCEAASNLFLDPDTGVRLSPCGGYKSVNYVFGPELAALSQARPKALTLVFDQSFSRGSQGRPVQEKLASLTADGVHGFAYSSHAQFLVLSADAELVHHARERLLEVSGLPASRMVGLST
jgi:hypothetical protein